MGYDKGASTSGTTGRIVAFELPEGIMTDEEIKEISTDVSVLFSYMFSYYCFMGQKLSFLCTKVTLYLHQSYPLYALKLS